MEPDSNKHLECLVRRQPRVFAASVEWTVHVNILLILFSLEKDRPKLFYIHGDQNKFWPGTKFFRKRIFFFLKGQKESGHHSFALLVWEECATQGVDGIAREGAWMAAEITKHLGTEDWTFDYGTNIYTMQSNLSATRRTFQARNKLYLHAFILTGKGGRVNCEFGGKWSAEKVEMCRHGLPSATWVKITQRIHHFFYPCNFGKWPPHSTPVWGSCSLFLQSCLLSTHPTIYLWEKVA